MVSNHPKQQEGHHQPRRYERGELFTLERIRKLRTNMNLSLSGIKSYIPVVGTKGKTSIIILLTSFIKKEIPNGAFLWPPLPIPSSINSNINNHLSNIDNNNISLHTCLLINNEFVSQEEWNEAINICNNADPFQLCTNYEKAFLTSLYIFNERKLPLIFIESAIGGEGDATSLIKEMIPSNGQLCTILTKVDGDRKKLLGIQEQTNYVEAIYNCYLSISTNKILTLEKCSLLPKAYSTKVEELPITIGADWRNWIREIDHVKEGENYMTEMINFSLKIYQFLCLEFCFYFNKNCVPRFSSLLFRHSTFSSSSTFKLGDNIIIVDPSDSYLSASIQSLKIDAEREICLVLGISNARNDVELLFSSLMYNIFNYGCGDVGGRERMGEVNFVPFKYPRQNCPEWIKPLEGGRIEFKDSVNIKNGKYGSIEEVFTGVMRRRSDKGESERKKVITIITGSPYIVEDFYKIL